jgi:hypothetical protein
MSTHPLAHAEVEVGNLRMFAIRSLDVLRAIDQTLDGLNVELLEGMTHDVEQALARLRRYGAPGRVDGDGTLASTLDAAIDIVAQVHTVLPRTRADMRAGAAERVDACVALLERLHRAFADLHEWVATHDALLDAPLPGAYASADALFKAISQASANRPSTRST